MAFKKTFVISDETVNSHGFVVLTSGIRLDNAKKNCPAFYDHNTWETPIGHWENLRVENGRLLGDLVIEGADDREKEMIRKIQNGDIKGASGGFDPITWTDDPQTLKQGQTAPTLSESEIFEASITPLPANSNCLALKKEKNLVVLSGTNTGNIIPSLTKNSDMKKIALMLGLPEGATEAEIITELTALQLSATAMRNHIEAQVDEQLEGEPHKKLFKELSKTNISQALAFLALNRSTVAAATTAEVPASEASQAVKKDVKVSELIKTGKTELNRSGDGGKDKTDCFDYYQRRRPTELARIKKEEPERYSQLLEDYKSGVRFVQ